MKSVQEFVEGLCSIPEQAFTDEGVSEYLAASPVEPGSLAPHLLWKPTHYTRNLIFRNALFELMSICWDVGQASRIHNHAGQRCWMAVPIGRLVVQNYEVVGLDAGRGHCELREADRVEMDPAHPSRVNQEHPVHAVLNLPDYGARAASLHIYSRPYDRCLVYDLAKSSYCEVPLFFDSEYGERVAAPGH
jgi:cysteine dioxygenase